MRSAIRNFQMEESLKYVGQVNSEVGYGPLLKEYVYFLSAKLAFHRQHPEFNGMSATKGLDYANSAESFLRPFRI